MTPADYATAAAIAVLGAWSWAKATEAGKEEAEQIARNIALNINEDLPHDELLMDRIGTIGVVWVAVSMVLGWWVSWWLPLPLAALAWAVFTMRHRYALNRARRKQWLYIAPWGNVYDRRIYWITQGFRPLTDEHLDYLKDVYIISLPDGGVAYGIHRAGLVAYAFEVLVAAGAVVVAIWIA